MKRFVIIMFLLFPVLLFSQTAGNEGGVDFTSFPVQSVRSQYFTLKNLSFNKLVADIHGESVEVEFQIDNNIDMSQELYIFVIATYEKSYKTKSSFEDPRLDDPVAIKLFVPYPYDMANFEYMERDESGTEKKVMVKYPKDIKAGIDAETGKPYLLENTLTFRSRHLSKYGKKFHFFNEICILIFDKDEKLVYRQLYKLKGNIR